MIVIKAKWWVKGIWGANYQVPLGIPILLYGDHPPNSYDDWIHEKIHVRQAVEMLYVPFWIMYAGHYFYNRLIKRMKHDAAYRGIVFEREAYDCQKDVTYLKGRKFWAWTRHFLLIFALLLSIPSIGQDSTRYDYRYRAEWVAMAHEVDGWEWSEWFEEDALLIFNDLAAVIYDPKKTVIDLVGEWREANDEIRENGDTLTVAEVMGINEKGEEVLIHLKFWPDSDRVHIDFFGESSLGEAWWVTYECKKL